MFGLTSTLVTVAVELVAHTGTFALPSFLAGFAAVSVTLLGSFSACGKGIGVRNIGNQQPDAHGCSSVRGVLSREQI
jgi:hypothetical protein